MSDLPYLVDCNVYFCIGQDAAAGSVHGCNVDSTVVTVLVRVRPEAAALEQRGQALVPALGGHAENVALAVGLGSAAPLGLAPEAVTLGTAALPVAQYVRPLHISEGVAALGEDGAHVGLVLDPGALAQVSTAVGAVIVLRPLGNRHELEHVLRVPVRLEEALGRAAGAGVVCRRPAEGQLKRGRLVGGAVGQGHHQAGAVLAGGSHAQLAGRHDQSQTDQHAGQESGHCGADMTGLLTLPLLKNDTIYKSIFVAQRLRPQTSTAVCARDQRTESQSEEHALYVQILPNV